MGQNVTVYNMQVACRQGSFPYSLQRLLLDRSPLCSLTCNYRPRGSPVYSALNHPAGEGVLKLPAALAVHQRKTG